MFQDSLTKKIAEAASKIKTEYHEVEVNVNSVEGAVEKIMNEKLIGNQHKIDANKNNKVDAHDFKLLRAKKKMSMKKEEVEIEEGMQQTLRKYVPGYAKHQLNKKMDAQNYAPGDSTKKTVDKDVNYARYKKIADKLNKEEVDLDEAILKSTGHALIHSSSKKIVAKGNKEEMMKKMKELNTKEKGSHYVGRTSGKVGDTFGFGPSPANKLSIRNEEVDLDEDDEDENKMKSEEVHNKKKDLPFTPDAAKKPVRNSDGTIQKPMSLARELAKRGLKKAMSKEETEIDEAMFPGTKEYEKKFGQSPQQKLKKKGDTVPTSQGEMKKTDKGIAHRRKFTEMIESYAEGGLKYIASLVQEEPDNEQFTKEVDDIKRKATQKKSPEDEARVAKASVQAVKQEETEIQVINADIANGVEMVDIEERSLTEPEMKKKEEIVMSMKKKMPGFKERYGDRAKEVVYATATKMAKKD